MKVTIGTNIASLRGIRQLDKTSSALSRVFERLSSGQRINRASDDAAGLAISESLNAEARIKGTAIRNLNDGISLISIAEAAVAQLGTIVTRQMELSEQAANGVYGSSQRRALQAEADALTEEYNRIIEGTEFNGVNLFNEGLKTTILQTDSTDIDALLAVQLGTGLNRSVGTGEIANVKNLGVGQVPFDMAVADFDGDGHLDIAAAETGGSGAIRMRFGQGNGNFTTGPTYDFGINDNPISLVAADFNGDGHTDFASLLTTNNQIAVRLNNGDGTFGSNTNYAVGSLSTGFLRHTMETGDINNDGHLDLVYGNRDSNSIEYLLGDGNGGFGSLGSFSTGRRMSSIALGDLNGDGNLDVVAGNMDYSTFDILYGDGAGNFQQQAVTNPSFDVEVVEIADIDHDGYLDIIAAGEGQAQVYFNKGSGTYDTPVNVSLGTSVDLDGIHSTDINGDGESDLAFATNDGNLITIVGNGQRGFYNPISTASSSTKLWNVESGDFNEDGVIDFVSANEVATGRVHVFIQHTESSAKQARLNLYTQESARTELDSLRQELERINTERAALGNAQSRIGYALSNLAISRENTLAAAASIMDANIADESAALTRYSILQNAASAVLAQANQQPALALQLLG